MIEGEQPAAGGSSLITLDDVIAKADAAVWRSDNVPGSGTERLTVLLAAVLIGETIASPPESKVVSERLQALNPAVSTARPSRPAGPAVRTLCLGDLSARIIEEASDAGQALALTQGGELIGIVVPVTQDLMEFLVEQNMSRVLYNIGMAEKQLCTLEEMTSLDAFPDTGTAKPGPLFVS